MKSLDLSSPFKRLRILRQILLFKKHLNSYIETYENRHLNLAIGMFEQLENLISKYVYDGALPNNNPQMNRVEIDGWGSQKTLSHLSLKQIQNLNPDADEISIKRVDRKDVESARGKSYKNCGFRIVLTVPIGRQVFLNESSYQIYPQSSNSSVLKFVDRKSPEYLINNLNRSNSKELFFVDVMTESKVYLKFGKDLKLIQSVKKYLQKSSDELGLLKV